MELLELVVGEVGDDLRVAAGVAGVVVVREELALHLLVVDAVGLRVDALHLVEDYALDAHVGVRAVELVVPALLLEDLRVREAAGVEHRVHVHITQVVEVLQDTVSMIQSA